MRIQQMLFLGVLASVFVLNQGCTTMYKIPYPKQGLTTMAPWSPKMSPKNKNKPKGFAVYSRMGFFFPPDYEESISDFLKRANSKTLTGVKIDLTGFFLPVLRITGEYSGK